LIYQTLNYPKGVMNHAPTIHVMNKIDKILDYWFEGVDDSTAIDIKNTPFKKWFIKDEKIDQDIREEFESDLIKAGAGEYKKWEETLQGRLALTILFDQFTRNMYRDTINMYAYDAVAVELTQCTIKEDTDKDLMHIERAFIYLPLMHSEDVKLQKQSVECFTKLVEDAKVSNADNVHYYEYSLKHAKEHHDTVVEFGRFPHRDAILNRNAQQR